MIQNIIDNIYKLIEYSNVKKLIYISIDGVAPGGKLKQQKMRRDKSILENKLYTNAISVILGHISNYIISLLIKN